VAALAGRVRATAILIVAAAAIVWGASLLPNYELRVLDSVLLYVLLAMGLNIVVGYCGLLDLGFIAFYAVGAYSYALLASPHTELHWPFGAVLVVAALLGLGAGVLLGIPVLRLRGDYLAIVTLGFGEIIRVVINNADALTNGPKGISRIYRATLFGWTIATPLDFFYLLLGVCAICFMIVWRLERSILGKAWAAVREDQDAARGVGVDTTFVKLCAFGLSAMIGSVAGVIFAAFQRFVSPESFVFQESLLVVLVVVVGGLGNLLGVIVGATVLIVLPELLREYAQYRMLIYGLMLVGIVLVRPRGLVPKRFDPAWLMVRLGWR